MLVNRLGAVRKIRGRGVPATLLALVMTGSALTATTAPAQAAGNIPWTGALCTAMENIQFWNDQGQTSYTAYQGEYIRVDVFYGYSEPVAQGHGSGHSTRWFYWRHTNGTFRVQDCH